MKRERLHTPAKLRISLLAHLTNRIRKPFPVLIRICLILLLSGGSFMASVPNVVAKALTFKGMLTTTQQGVLQQNYTAVLAHKWSNLPCGSSCRNGIQFSTLTTLQLAAAKDILTEAAGTAVSEGYKEFMQIVTADSLLGTTAGSGYSKGLYFISFLNTPSTTGQWMLQFGGHHYAANIAFNNGVVVGCTPIFEGVEPKTWTNGQAVATLDNERNAMANMLASLTATQFNTAKLTTSFSDVVLGPNQDGNFPATKVGVQVSSLSAAQQSLVMQAMEPWLADADSASAATLRSVYQSELSGTYIAFTGNATAGNSATFLNTNTNYVRIDGPTVWIEFVCQTGVVYNTQIHYHSVWRDHTRDYGQNMTLTTLGPTSATAVTANISAAGATTLCGGSSVVLTANSGAGYTYQWKLNGNNISGATSASYTAATTGTYVVVVTSGTTTATSTAITITAGSVFPVISGVTTFCSGVGSVLNAGSGYSTYAWSNGATTQSIGVTNGGTYSVLVTNPGGCQGSASVVTTAKASPAPTINGNLAFCSGSSTSLTAGSGFSSYLWSTGSASQSITVSSGGAFNVTVTATNGCQGSSTAVTTVNSLPATPVITSNGGVLTSSAASGNQWYLNGTLIPGANSQTYAAMQAGIYTVIVTENDCVSNSSTGFTTVDTGLKNLSNDASLSVYPNPAKDILYLDGTIVNNDSFNVWLFDMQGKQVQNYSNSKAVTITEIPNGIYMLNIKNEITNSQVFRKIIILH